MLFFLPRKLPKGNNNTEEQMYYDPQTNQPRRSKVYLVCGAPASGKTTYVKQHKEPGDFVLDLDVLRQALGAPVKISDCFQPQVMAIRDLLYQHIVFNKIGATKKASAQ